MKRRTIGIIIFVVGFIYGVVETRYFGSHFLPKSPEEIIADGLALVILAIVFSQTARDK